MPSELIEVQPHVSIWSDLSGIDLRQRMVQAGGVRTRVLEAGEGPALVMVHGTGGHLEAYARNVRELSRHFRLVLYDMLGHGYTDKPDRPYTIDVLSAHLLDVMDALGIERAHVSGESLGGRVAAWTAANSQQRVDRLVLNTPGNITNKPTVVATVKSSSLQAVREASLASVRQRVEWLFYDKSLVTDELVRLRLAIYRVVLPPEVRARMFAQRAFTARTSAELTNQLFLDSGAMSLFETSAMQQLWRDANAAAMHMVLGRGDALTSLGRNLMGLPGHHFALSRVRLRANRSSDGGPVGDE